MKIKLPVAHVVENEHVYCIRCQRFCVLGEKPCFCCDGSVVTRSSQGK